MYSTLQVLSTIAIAHVPKSARLPVRFLHGVKKAAEGSLGTRLVFFSVLNNYRIAGHFLFKKKA